MNLKKIENEMAEKLEELFPKGERGSCGERLPCRSRALVFNAYAVMAIRKAIKQVVESVPVEKSFKYCQRKRMNYATKQIITRQKEWAEGYNRHIQEVKQWKKKMLKELK